VKTLTVYTNLYSDEETISDVRRRGKTARFHPDPESARADARGQDLIVELDVRLPDDAEFLLYRETERGTALFAQGPDFAAAYTEAGTISKAGRSMATAVITALPGRERLIVPLADFATGLSVHLEALLAA
jgi:hypothetical protein